MNAEVSAVTVIYVDLLLGVNLVIDYILLCGCARVLQLPAVRWRLIAGAGIGALSSLLILLDPLPPAVSLLCKLVTALVMVPVSFPIKTLSRFCKATLTLFFVSALFAGICAGIVLLASPVGVLVQSGIVYVQLPPLLLLLMIVISYGALCLYDRFTRRRLVRGTELRVEIDDVPLRAMFDSGHRLRESFSGAPVIIVSRKALGAWQGRDATPRYIPFSSIGGGGMLPSFRPHHAVLYAEGKIVTLDHAWVAVSDRLGDDCDALIGPDVLNLL